MPIPAALGGLFASKGAFGVTMAWIGSEILHYTKKGAKTAAVAGAYLGAVTLALDAIKTELIQRLVGLPIDLLAILSLMGVDHALTIITSAALTKHALRALSNGQTAQ